METDFNTKLKEAETWLQKEYAGIRTGQASPMLLDGIKVESYGSLVPLNQVGNIGIEDARTLRVSLWDSSQVAAVEQALTEADLGVSVASDSSGVRVIFPELTAERRTQLLKLAKEKLEEARIRIRTARDDEMKVIDKSQKDGDRSEDEAFTEKESIQKQVEAANQALDTLFKQKETELQN